MLYKFKSSQAADVIMLEATGRQALQIIGKGWQTPGILLPEHMPAALAALKAAVLQEEAAQAERRDAPSPTRTESEDASTPASVSLRARLWPFVLMIERSQQGDAPITWGV
jgi:Domain of unknown function (DUF1840)